MDIGVIAKRYARALLQYARLEKAEDVVYDEVRQFILDYGAVPRLREVLHDPLLAPAEKERILRQAAAVAGNAVSPVFSRFAALVVAHRREAYMLFIAHSYVDLYRQLKGIRIARLTTAVPVGPDVPRRLSQWAAAATAPAATAAQGPAPTGQGRKAAGQGPVPAAQGSEAAAQGSAPGQVLVETEVNPDLLGGFIFQIDDRRLDASVASQFQQIKKQFIEKNKRIV